jgi:demethylmenaquinone methyltransferase/2-methoxy-6-polyprenyl-1,4-benzoquinol methylase
VTEFDKHKKRQQVKEIFDDISPKYDFLNHLLSLGIDKRWRKKALKLTGLSDNTLLLDVACGTGDFAIQAYKYGVQNIIGADFSGNMLRLFNKKAEWSRGNTVQLTAEEIPLKEECVTNITVAFGVRNFFDIPQGFHSFYSILKKGGKVTILEFSLPKNRVIGWLYSLYFKKILPGIGGLIAGNRAAYQYLPDSVEEFDKKVNLQELLKEAGFSKVRRHLLSFGVVQVVIAEK